MDGRIFHIKTKLSQDLGRHWTVSDMAGMVGLSVSRLHKLFRIEIGHSPIAFLHELRLEKARKLLEVTFLQIKQVGYKTGLTNDSHLTRDFKRKFGITPTE